MAPGTFIWCDLSTVDPAATHPFYERVMDWKISGGDYATATRGGEPVAGIFPMPQKFRDIGLPSFWMSYIAVEDVGATVDLATQHGGKVELGPAPFERGGDYALIRDPLGAGFTVYRGSLASRTARHAGKRMGHGLFVSDASAVTGFYAALFGWRFGDAVNGVMSIHAGNATIAHLHEIPDPAIRGKEEYWAVLFAGDTSDAAMERIRIGGGMADAPVNLPEGTARLIRDPDGAGFFIVSPPSSPGRSSPQWKAWTGLALMGVGLVTGWSWLWAVFFGGWLLAGLVDGQTYVFEPVSRQAAPLLYWLLMGSYLVFLALSLIGDI